MNVATKPDQKTAAESSLDKLAQQIFDVMVKVHGVTPGYRVVHAKGIVCTGTFTPSKEAAALSKAAHFQQPSVPMTIRFSDAGPDPTLPENSPDSGPRGIAVRFHLPGGGITDIVALSHNGFVVGNGEEFLELQKAIVATDPSKPHPWPIEAFLGARPLALKFVMDSRVMPASFATEAFFSNSSFVFVNKSGAKQTVRYQILPVAGRRDLTEEEAKARSANYRVEELKTRLAAGAMQFRLMLQLPNSGDPTHDPSLVWPDDRRTIDAGTISVTSVVADSDGVEKDMIFDPTHLTDGIELSDDHLPLLRSKVYSLSYAYRHRKP
jgi:catalase